jgi:bifunctional NMN adenylyltransferase/nudix hydrolase
MRLVVFIGRFQPLHYGHLKQLRSESIDLNSSRILLLLGTHTRGRTLKDPFTFEERKEMILNSLTNEELHRITIEPIYDIPSENVWQYNVIQLINKNLVNRDKDSVYLVGNDKDDSSYYINNFPDYEYIGVGHDGIHATDIRYLYFKTVLQRWQDKLVNQTTLAIDAIKDLVPKGTYEFLKRESMNKEFLSLAESNIKC